jgi:MoxR-like ATPase
MTDHHQGDSANATDMVAQLRALRDQLTAGLVERDDAVRLGLLAALAGEHLLMLGPPGTAKSLVARRLHLAFSSSTYFERLLTRFTVPEELFGPLSIKGLEDDRYERLTKGYLPTASIAFLDEIFKANSAILNSLLTLLNEREFDNGTVRTKTPLVAVVGASNELPDVDELAALFDRFLLRLHVGPVSKEAFADLLGLRGHQAPAISEQSRLSLADLEQVRMLSERVHVPDDVVTLLTDLREWCAAEKIAVSDRRWRKIVHLLQVSAATNGRERVSVWDCWLLQHCVWNTPESREKVYAWYAARVGASAAMDPSRLSKIVVVWEARLEGDRASRSQMRDKEGRPLFVDAKGARTVKPRGNTQCHRDGEPLFLCPTGNLRGDHLSLDRENNGAGFTKAELDTIQLVDKGRWCPFSTWSGRNAYLAEPSNWLMKEGDLAAVLEPTRHKPIYIDSCLADIERLRLDVHAYRDELDAHKQTLEADIREHLWLDPQFAPVAAENLARTRHEVDVLLARVGRLSEGFTGLPREGQVKPKDAPPKQTPSTSDPYRPRSK